LLRRGDVLFNRTNSADMVGKTALFAEDGEFSFAGYLIRLRCGAALEPQYLTTFMNVPDTKTKLRAMCKSIVGMANINAKEVQAMSIMVPPLEMQQEFASRVAAVERLKVTQRAQLIELDNLFLSLQDRAFKGEL
jgi:type I restriction enzyme, S subunit